MRSGGRSSSVSIILFVSLLETTQPQATSHGLKVEETDFKPRSDFCHNWLPLGAEGKSLLGLPIPGYFWRCDLGQILILLGLFPPV